MKKRTKIKTSVRGQTKRIKKTIKRIVKKRWDKKYEDIIGIFNFDDGLDLKNTSLRDLVRRYLGVNLRYDKKGKVRINVRKGVIKIERIK